MRNRVTKPVSDFLLADTTDFLFSNDTFHLLMVNPLLLDLSDNEA